MRSDIQARKSDVEGWILEGRTKASIYHELDCKPETLDRYLSAWGIRYSGHKSKKGRANCGSRRKPEEYLTRNSTFKSHVLRLWLIRDGVKEERCESCGMDKWLDGKIPLELHHIDGDRSNNTLENLKIICPNCHALTENHAGKGRKKSRLLV